MQDFLDLGSVPVPLKTTTNPQYKEPIYVLLKHNNAYKICIKNPQGLSAGVLLGNDIPELINKFDCSDEQKIKLLDQYEELKNQPGKNPEPIASGGYDPKYQKRPKKEDYSLYHTLPLWFKR